MRNFLLENKKIVKNVVILGLAYLTGIALAMVHDYGITGIEIIVPCLMVLAGIVYHKAFSVYTKKDVRISVIFGFIFALTETVGSKIDFYDHVFNGLSILDIATYPFLGLFFSAVFLLLFSWRDEVSVLRADKEADSSNSVKEQNGVSKKGRLIVWIKKHPFLSLWLLNIIGFLPYYLTFFPGNCGPDTWESIKMVLGEIPWTNHHPVLFTGLIMVVIKATSFLPLTISVGVFSFLQLLSFAAVLAYLVLRICKTQTHWVVKTFAVLFCAFHPFMGMYSIYLSKDVLFAEIMVLLCFKIYDLLRGDGELLHSPKKCVELAVLFLLSCMLRNNGLYISVIMAVIFLFLYRKYWKQILLIFICVIGLFKIWQGPVFKSMGIEKQSFAEAASVPLQQIGFVLWEGKEFSAEDMAFLEELMPIQKVKEVYQPGYTDMYKFDEEFNDDFLNDNVGRFLTVWWHGCTQYFGEYVEAYLHQTVGYWHYGVTNSVCTQGITENTLGVDRIDVIENLSGFSLEPIFEKLVLAGRKAPVICMLASMAMEVLMVFILIARYIRSGRGKLAVWLIPLVVLWGTIMVATPAFCLFRYLFPLFLLWPFMIAEFFE